MMQISTGSLFSGMLTQKGDLYVCGCGKHGRLGTGSEDDEMRPVKITMPNGAKIAQVWKIGKSLSPCRGSNPGQPD